MSHKNQIKAIFIYLSRKKFLLKLFTTDSQEKSYLLIHNISVFIEEILLSKTFITEWTSISLYNAWVLHFVSISSKLSTINQHFKGGLMQI